MDIGSIHPGQPVNFTVWTPTRGMCFAAKSQKIRLNATMARSVVAYIVEVTTDNSSGRILPCLTAEVQFELGRRTGVWLVPNAALRWSPSPGKPSEAPAILNDVLKPPEPGQGKGTPRPRSRKASSRNAGPSRLLKAASCGRSRSPSDSATGACSHHGRFKLWKDDSHEDPGGSGPADIQAVLAEREGK